MLSHEQLYTLAKYHRLSAILGAIGVLYIPAAFVIGFFVFSLGETAGMVFFVAALVGYLTLTLLYLIAATRLLRASGAGALAQTVAVAALLFPLFNVLAIFAFMQPAAAKLAQRGCNVGRLGVSKAELEVLRREAHLD